MRMDLGALSWEVMGYWPNAGRFRPDRPLVGPVPATVPGAVQADLQAAGVLPDLNVGFASREAEWVEHRDWVYRTHFPTPEGDGLRRFLQFDGLDHSGEISLNGRSLGRFSGMFRPVTLEVTEQLAVPGADNTLTVAFDPPPEVTGQIGYTSRIAILKSRFNYQWDWCPRIVPVGIWEDARLVTTGPVRILGVSAVGDWDDSAGILDARIFLEGPNSAAHRVEVRVVSAEGHPIWTGEVASSEGTAPLAIRGMASDERHLHVRLFGVRPWWPSVLGAQPLYRVEVRVIGPNGEQSDEYALDTGFRRIAFVANPGAPESALPYTCLCNGQRVFLQGVNWVPPSPLYGQLRSEDYAPLLERFRRMGCTLLRVWGGAVIERQAFYDLCDAMGLLVWQEFLQSSSGLDNVPPDDPTLVAELAFVSSHAILRRRAHPCLAAWGGGNELTQSDGTPVTIAHPNIAALASLLAEEDPGRMFFPSSPSGPRFGGKVEDAGLGLHHDVHGPWGYRGHPAQYAYFNADDALVRSEMGAPGASRMEVLNRIAAGHALWPPSHANPLWVHHGEWWIQWYQMLQLFGPWREDQPDLPAYVACSRYLQAEALRYCIESVRRREPKASGALIWMGNEPYANTANNSLLEYDGEPKPAYGVLRRSFAPLHASCRYERVAHRPGDEFCGEIWIHARGAEPPTEVVAELWTVRGALLLRQALPVSLSCPPSAPVGTIRWSVEPVPSDVFLLRLHWGDAVCQSYAFTVTDGPPFAPLRRLPSPDLTLAWSGDGVRVRNQGPDAALGVHLSAHGWDVTPNDFDCLPGEERQVRLDPLRPTMIRPACIRLEAMGLAPIVLR